MGLYTHKRTVEAHRWFKNGDHPEDDCSELTGRPPGQKNFLSEGKVVRRFRRPDIPGDAKCPCCGKTFHEHGWIDTPAGGHVVCPGDWIITGSEGGRWPLKPAIFGSMCDELTEGGG